MTVRSESFAHQANAAPRHHLLLFLNFPLQVVWLQAPRPLLLQAKMVSTKVTTYRRCIWTETQLCLMTDLEEVPPKSGGPHVARIFPTVREHLQYVLMDWDC